MNISKLTFLAMLLALLSGCGGELFGAASGGPNFGATQGGNQDMTLARELVEQGMVPPAEAFVVEAMFSEHDLPLQTQLECSALLCLNAALGVIDDAGGQPAAWTQIGMSSTVDPETYQRPTLALVFVIDVSGSMGYDYPGNSTAGSIARQLASDIVANLEESDRVGIITFDSQAYTRLQLTHGADPQIQATIDALNDGGSTNMEAGVLKGFEMAQGASGTQEVRVVLITDAQPNVGLTEPSYFEEIIGAGAEEGIGLTIFGTGLGLSPLLMTQISHLRGGNGFSLMDTEALPEFMDDNWPWMFSPIAYDLTAQVRSSDNGEIVNAYGFPGSTGADPTLSAATVFLSKGRGALLLESAAHDGYEAAELSMSLTLSYRELDGALVEASLEAQYDGTLDAGLSKTVALALLVDGMEKAASAYGDDTSAAIETLTATLDRFGSDAATLGDADLVVEADFWPRLLQLMLEGAPQGTFYP